MNPKIAYLDIETSYQNEITIIGIHFPGFGTQQLVGDKVTATNLLEILDGSERIITYNGDRFDLPVIRKRLGIDLKVIFPHRDLMFLCWKVGLKGGLKAVEKHMGLVRETEGIDGMQAMALWAAWINNKDTAALNLLLKYNREDIENLVKVEEGIERLLSTRA